MFSAEQLSFPKCTPTIHFKDLKDLPSRSTYNLPNRTHSHDPLESAVKLDSSLGRSTGEGREEWERKGRGVGLRQKELQMQNKLRYEHILQLQHVSLLEKQEYTREREQQLKDAQARTEARVKLVKEQQRPLGRSTRDWHHRNLCEAAQQRVKRMAEQLYCSEREHIELAEKQELTSARRHSFRMARRQSLRMGYRRPTSSLRNENM